MKMANLLSLCRISFVLSLWIIPATAEDIDKQQNALKAVKSDIKTTRRTVAKLTRRKGSLEEQLRDLEQRYSSISIQVREHGQQVVEIQQRMKVMIQQRDQLQHSITQQGGLLSSQIRSAYALGRQERLKLILNQTDPARVSRVWAYYGYLNRARSSRLNKYQTDYKQLQTLEKETVETSEQLTTVLEDKQTEQAKVAQNRKARKGVLVQLSRQLKTKAARLKQLESNKKRLQRLITALQSRPVVVPEPVLTSATQARTEKPIDKLLPITGLATPFHKQRGHLFWPVKGRVLKKFGSKRAPGRWDGLLIEAAEGVPVRAVSRGRVAFADWLRGYGLLTIIDHGKGYMTLYAFNESLNKNVGDWVNAGDAIATVGNSGGRSQTGLYFEVRKKGKPVNPLRWLRKA